MKFNDLIPEQQEKALEKCRYINVEGLEWWECLVDCWTEKLETLGFHDVEILFSLSYSQGNGASFTAKWEGDDSKCPPFLSERYFRLLQRADCYSIHCRIKRTQHLHYFHENTISADLDIDWETDSEELNDYLYYKLDSERDNATEWARSISQDIYSDLTREYKYLTSDEAVVESIEANGIDFIDASGCVVL